jgi:uncharacterized membrane protein YoaK (UPF0700 family)
VPAVRIFFAQLGFQQGINMTTIILALVLWAMISFMAGNFASFFCRHYMPAVSKCLVVSTLFTFGAAIFLMLHGLGMVHSVDIYQPLANAGSAALLGTTYLLLQIASQLRNSENK